MRLYELLFITKPDYDDERVASVISRYTDLITNANGIIESAEKWGKRRLAYEIDDMREGVYVQIDFQAESVVIAELDRLMKIDQDVMRHMVSRIEHKAKKTSRKAASKPRADEVKIQPTTASPTVRVVDGAVPEGEQPESNTVAGAQ